MGGRRILSDADLDELAELREERGFTSGQIRNHFLRKGIDVSVGSIDWQCLRLGIDLPPERRQASKQRDQPYRRGDGRLVRPFTPADDRRLVDLEARGLRISRIAKELGRPDNSIRGRLYILARREARAEEMAS